MGLRLKFFFSFIAVTPFVFALFIGYSIHSQYNENKTSLLNKAHLLVDTQANSLTIPLWNLDQRSINDILSFFARDVDFVKAVILDTDGKEAFVFPKNPPPDSTLIGENYIVLKQSMSHNKSEPLGTLIVTFSLNTLNARYRNGLILGIIEFFALCLADYLILTMNLKKLVFAPLLSHVDVTNRFSAGDLTARIPVKNTDEIALIGVAFNQMADSIENYSHRLQNMVDEKTKALQGKMKELQDIQQKIITQEKMASLGSLTAGIAHEIKNPLNFVINFSALTRQNAVNLEKIFEKYKDAFQQDDKTSIGQALNLIKENLTTTNQQAKRADAVINRMLEHSRSQKAEATPADINTLIEEFITLSYYGMRVQDPNFVVKITQEFDYSVPPINIITSDMSRVFLNLLSNAYYSVNQKRKKLGEQYSPEIIVKTKVIGNVLEIRFHDNGMGIKKNVMSELFSPFFTTKPIGEGVGLGLSLSHEIIVKEHKGSIEIESQDGEYAEFIIHLPIA